VKFSYLNNTIFNNITFKINKGESVAIVGKNGSGKTTLLNLIAGLIKPNEGQVIVDNIFDIYPNKNIWFQGLSYVQQNIFLMDTTIKQNIILTNENKIDVKKLNRIIDILKLEEVFTNLPNQLDAKVGINGISLSGGQKQIISLARALYKDGDIIVFDEATSALDSNMTELVKNLIFSLKGTKTIIMVTHNLDYFFSCFDKIIEIENKSIKILKG
jgi:ATP-binding cassette subfamily B protein